MKKMAVVIVEGAIPHTIPECDVAGFLRDHGPKARLLDEKAQDADKPAKKRGRTAKTAKVES